MSFKVQWEDGRVEHGHTLASIRMLANDESLQAEAIRPNTKVTDGFETYIVSPDDYRGAETLLQLALRGQLED